MKPILTLFAAFAALAMNAQNMGNVPLEIPLWPDGPAVDNEIPADRKAEFKKAGMGLLATDDPVLYVYPAGDPDGAAILACPGGAYIGWAGGHEGNDMASWITSQGVTFAVLRYRMPYGHKEVPLSDVEQAMRILKERAGEWGIDTGRIGVMGASAGGHLAASLATLHTSEETRPAFQILFYPVITMKEGVTHQGSRENLLGMKPSEEDVWKYSLENQVNARTPEAFIMLSADDDIVPAENSMSYSSALLAHGVPVALYMYPTGLHGWGFKDEFIYKRQWTGELEKWLRERVLK